MLKFFGFQNSAKSDANTAEGSSSHKKQRTPRYNPSAASAHGARLSIFAIRPTTEWTFHTDVFLLFQTSDNRFSEHLSHTCKFNTFSIYILRNFGSLFANSKTPLLCSKSKSILRGKPDNPKASENSSSTNKEEPTPADDMSYQQDPLLNHPHFRKIKDLNEGTFGFVQLAKDVRRNEPVSLPCCSLVALCTRSEAASIVNQLSSEADVKSLA